ncbi:MAG TPA: hypothetical protein VHX60_07050 [Acidobacteriaceae bacterium]|jgi:hypothetical protein|nr:hypothetical protein [Acidobacteriaceae bacterium]
MQHRVIARSSDPDDLDDTLATILNALAQHKISPTSAGRLLQAILDRKRELQLAAQQAAFRAVQQAYLRRIRPQAAPAAV